ncbi:MAG: hypothetical protein NTX61_13420 [Bacteroidetes bacterium]|nr:hypothetical protein [Bacteroidota bacterium]
MGIDTVLNRADTDIVQPAINLLNSAENTSTNISNTVVTGVSNAATDFGHFVNGIIQWGEDQGNAFIHEIDDLKNSSQESFQLVDDFFNAINNLKVLKATIDNQNALIRNNNYTTIQQWLSPDNVQREMILAQNFYAFIENIKTIVRLLKKLVDLCGDDLKNPLEQIDPNIIAWIDNA